MPFAPLSRLPKGALVLMKEVARHILRRPVIGIAAAARRPDGKWVLIQRADTGTWALPGGTLEWGETLREALSREVEEEAGIVGATPARVVGVYSRPDRDPRFHGVTVVVLCEVELPTKAPVNPMEIIDVKAFAYDVVPELAFGMRDMLKAAHDGGEAELE